MIVSFRVSTSKNENIDHRVKKNLCYLLGQYKLHIKPTSLYAVNQQSQIALTLFFYIILLQSKRKRSYLKNYKNVKKRNVYM